MLISHVFVLMYVLSSVCCELCRKNCRSDRIQGLRIVDCYRKEMTRIPHCLPKNTEVLDLSVNRIREIMEEDLQPYPYLQILYLTDNILTEIDERALDDLTSLHTIDLSINPLYKIPRKLFSLPVLRKLLLGGIKNHVMVENIEDAVPFTSPLIHLDLSYNRLERLPYLGDVPTLKYYNVSGNKNVQVNTSTFAGLCNLEEFIDNDFSAVFKNPCDCFVLERWLTMRGVKFKTFNCEKAECADEIPAGDLDLYDNCIKQYEVLQQELYQKKLLTNVGISMGTIALFLLVLLYFILRRHKKRKQKRTAEAKAPMKQRKEGIDDLL